MNIEPLIEAGAIKNELEYARAMVADRKLRLLAKTSDHFKHLRIKLRDLIANYEDRVWSNEEAVGSELIEQSDLAAIIAENERVALEKSKRGTKSV